MSGVLPYRTLDRDWDVLVAGGGTAGAMAAVAAARTGARVLVLEAQGSLGGTGTNAWVTPLMRNVSAGRNLNRGLTDEMKARLHAQGDGATDPGGNDNWFNPEGLKRVLEGMLLESGGEVLYHTSVVAPVMNGPHLDALVVHNKGGLQALRAGVVVDATGDADVAVAAGADWNGGDEDGIHQAMSLRFTLAGVDLRRLCAFLRGQGQWQESPAFLHFWMVWGKNSTLEPIFRQAVQAGVLLERDGDYFQGFSVPGRPGEISFNCPRIRAEFNDGTDPWHLSGAQTDGREAVARLVTFCRRFLPGCKAAYIGQYAPMVGVRETRRIVGDYTLTLEDILDCRRFEDAICRNHYPVDIHSPRGARLIHEREGTAPYFAPDAFHDIPYRAIVPRGLHNVLVPGRAASSTFEAQSAIRVQQNCHSMGEAAGVAAAWAARDYGGDVRAVNTGALRAELTRRGGVV